VNFFILNGAVEAAKGDCSKGGHHEDPQALLEAHVADSCLFQEASLYRSPNKSVKGKEFVDMINTCPLH